MRVFDYRTARWDVGGGTTQIAPTLEPTGDQGAYGISADGSTIVGSFLANGDFRPGVARDGLDPVAIVSSSGGIALDASADGQMIVGGETESRFFNGLDGFLWTKRMERGRSRAWRDGRIS